MSDFEAIAARLYPSSAPSTPAVDTSTPAAAAEPVATSNDAAEAARAAQLARGAAINARTAADKTDAARKESFEQHGLWKTPDELPKPEVPDAIAELRNTPERRMFSSDVFATAVKTADAIDLASPLADIKSMAGIDLTQDQLEALKPVVAKELHAIYTDAGLTHEEAQTIEHVIVDVRTNKVNESPEADAANAQTAVQQLVEHYGNDAQAALDDARAFIARDPRIGKMLETSRAGNDPRMVLLAVEAARRARARGEKF